MTNLKALYIFEWFDNNFLESCIKSIQKATFKKWDLIIQEWSISDNAYILVRWIVSVSMKWKNINTIFEWDIFWEMWLVMNERRTATIQAETDVETLVLTRKELTEIIKRDPDGDYIKNTILNRIIQNNKNYR